MTSYITHIDVSLDEADEQLLQHQGFKRINVDLNKGAGGNCIYIWYKQGSEGAITGLQVTFNTKMAAGLTDAGYTKICKDLNAGAEGDFMYLWYSTESGEYNTPIVDITVTTDAKDAAPKFGNDWERLACDLNRRAEGNWIHIWVKRENKTYICDVTATDSYGSDSENFKSGYIRVDENTNRGTKGSPVFIWYRQTTDSKLAITNLDVSTNDAQYKDLQQQNYILVSVNLNEGTEGSQVYLWYKKTKSNKPIKAITLLLQETAVDIYKKAGIRVIERNVNPQGHPEYVCFYQE